jgi:hypothetical protein
MARCGWLDAMAATLCLLLTSPGFAAQLLFPQNRQAFYSDEAIEIAFADLGKGERTRVEFKSEDPGLRPVAFTLTGDGSTRTIVLEPRTFAPSAYTVLLDGKEVTNLVIASGVNRSTMLFSQTVPDPIAAGGNFIHASGFDFGLRENGHPIIDLRGVRSQGMDAFELAIKENMPTQVYLYWPGYHAPFGINKSWVNPRVLEAIRLLNFHTAQRLRRFSANILSIGTLDEPGLSWGKTPEGHLASGFPSWDDSSWYEERGWKFTGDPGAGSREQWLKYMKIRCGIIAEVNQQAKKDLKTVWPEVVFSTDLYAPYAIMDGTDPLNQKVNDLPASHVFLDWGRGKLGALSGVYLEKSHAPWSKLAHVMYGQSFGKTVGQPGQKHAYLVMRNALLASGLHSNRWLNPVGMKAEDLAEVNEPALRLGPLFRELAPSQHDVAVLWSFTELAMREKEITQKEAQRKKGEPIQMVAQGLPQVAGAPDGKVTVNASNVGQNYQDQVLGVHQALVRAGYPTHIIHEGILAEGVLKRYKTLVVVGQTFDLPEVANKAIADFVAQGGKVVVDRTTTVKFPEALVGEADWRDPAFRWSLPFDRARRKDRGLGNVRQASYYRTNHFMDEQVRSNVPAMKAVMQKTASRPAITSDSVELGAEKHTGGEGALYMVLNVRERLPVVPEDQPYPLYNYAALAASYHLQGIPPGSVVYKIEGADWSRVEEVRDSLAEQRERFEVGEMKLYLVAPRKPTGLKVTASPQKNALTVQASLQDLAMPWPLSVKVQDADGTTRYSVYRATDARGTYTESFPLGSNALPGTYTVLVESPVGRIAQQVRVAIPASTPRASFVRGAVRVFDEEALRQFLASKPKVVIALGDKEHQEPANQLAQALNERGIEAKVQPEADVFHPVAYPRVWNPYAVVYRARGERKKPDGLEVKEEVVVTIKEGALEVHSKEGAPLGTQWFRRSAIVTVAGEGLVFSYKGQDVCCEAGVQFHIDALDRLTFLYGEKEEVKTTAEFQQRWAKTWNWWTTFEHYTTDDHVILLGDSVSSGAVAALQASELLLQVADSQYPGPGKALLSYVWSPFTVNKNAIVIAASDKEGLQAGIAQLLTLTEAAK